MKKFLLSCSLLGLFATANAQVSSLNEDFEGAVKQGTSQTYGDYATLPYNGWEAENDYVQFPTIGISISESNKQILFNSGQGGRSTNTVYLFSPELTSVEGTLKFKFGGYTEKSGGRVIVGTTSDKYNVWGIKEIKELTIPENSTTDSGEIEIPATNGHKRIVFIYDALNNHFLMSLDNIVFTPKTLSITENTKENTTKFAVDRDALVFANKDVRSVKIYNANGSLVATEKVVQNSVNIAKLGTGVYFITIEDHNGNITKSKFIKK